MEDTLRDWDVSELNSHGETVLILVLMEDTLRVVRAEGSVCQAYKS